MCLVARGVQGSKLGPRTRTEIVVEVNYLHNINTRPGGQDLREKGLWNAAVEAVGHSPCFIANVYRLSLVLML